MTDLIQALSTALDRLAKVESILERLENVEYRLNLQSGILAGFEEGLDRVQILQNELGTSLALTDRNVNRLEDKVRVLQENGDGGEDLEDRIGEILDRKLDHVLEDAVTEALSGREITICL